MNRWRPVPQQLRLRWFCAGLLGFGVLGLGYVLTPANWLTGPGWLFAVIVWLYFWFFSGWHLAVHRSSETNKIETKLGMGNLLTLSRGWLLALLGGFLLGPEPQGFARWLPVLAYTGSDVADYLDGYLARRQGLATGLGEALDMELDGLGLLLAVGVAIHFGALPWWFIAFGAARYIFTLLIRVRSLLNLPVYELSPSQSRRPIAGLAMGYVSASLWPILDPPELTLAGIMFMLPFLASFLRDGLVVAGQLDPAGLNYLRWRAMTRAVILQWLPLFFRAGVLYLAVIEVPGLFKVDAQLMQVVSIAWIWQSFGLVIVLCCLAMALGWAARFAAFLCVFPFGLTIAATLLTPARVPALVSLLGLLMAGSGRFSLWKPSDEVFARRAGEPSR